tara:strand:- start:1502 stop:2923 length:1422 start_codon:yes stop_codon:yes gene_type:complete
LELNEKSVSKKQQRLFGMARAAQKGELENPSPEVSKIASTVSKSDVKKMASTKHKGLPEKKPAEVNETVSLVSVLHKLKEEGYPARREGPQKGLGAALCPVCGQMGCTKDHDAEEEVKEGVGDTIKKGLKRHKKAVDAKKVKERKAPPYAALAAEHEPEGEMVEDVHSGQGEKIAARTKKWMYDKGQKGAPGLDAMKARTAEHKAKRGVKEEMELEEERKARKMNVRTKKTIQTTIAKDAEKEAKRKANKTGEYAEKPKKRPSLKKPSQLTRVTGASKPAPKPAPRTQKGAMAYDGPNKERSEAADRVKAKTKAKRAAKKTPITKATVTKPEPKKKTATKPAAMKKAVERKKAVIKQPEKKAPEKKTGTKSFGDFYKQGVKRHRKATQAGRVFAKGAVQGAKKAVKFAKDVKKAVVGEEYIIEGKVKKIAAMIKNLRNVKPAKHDYGRDAGAIAKEVMRKKDHEKVNFLHPDD